MAPNEASRNGTRIPEGVDAYSHNHGGDPLSSTWQQGTKANFHSYESSGGAMVSHATASFVKDITAFTKSFVENKGNSKKIINRFISRMKSEYGIEVNVIP